MYTHTHAAQTPKSTQQSVQPRHTGKSLKSMNTSCAVVSITFPILLLLTVLQRECDGRSAGEQECCSVLIE